LDIDVRLLFSTPLLALACCALGLAGLLLWQIASAAGSPAGASLDGYALAFWLAASISLACFWLVNALRLVRVLGSPPNRFTRVGAFATAGLGALLAGLSPAYPALEWGLLAVSATCFTAFAVLRYGRRVLERPGG
jgi:hypothetical protein